MIRAVSRRRAQAGAGSDRGFTLIELLVVIVILGVLSAVVVFSVRGIGDRGEASARAIDARTLRTANEASCAQDGFYRSGQELADDGFVSEPPVYHQVEADSFDPDDPTLNGNCTGGEPEQASYRITCDASLPGCGEGGATALAWQQQTNLPPGLPTGFPGGILNDVSFVNRTHGWTVGGAGKILATTDGGESWTRQESGTTIELVEVDFVDPLQGFVVGWGSSPSGTRGIVLATEDGGATWVDRSPPVTGVVGLWNTVELVDGGRAWVAGVQGDIATTSNGGSDWSFQRPVGSPGLNRINTIRFVDDGTYQRGFAMGNLRGESNVLVTEDGGTTWTPSILAPGPDQPNLQDLVLIGDSHGWAVGVGSATVSNIFGTSDGGQSWAAQPPGPSDRLAVDFINERQGWAVGLNGSGGQGANVRTLDGGASWNIQELPISTLLFGVDFVDSAHGWAVSGHNVIFFYGPT